MLRRDRVSSGRLHDFNLTVRAGEVVGVFRLLGAGVHTIGRAVFGDEPRTGDVLLDGKTVRPKSPTDSIRKGLGLLTESRHEDGLVPFLSVQTNITLVALRKFATAGWIRQRGNPGRPRSRQAPGNQNPIAGAEDPVPSGGNQQKS